MQASLKYVADRDLLINPENEGEHASFKVVVILMMATGVYRLYTREDFRQFFERLSILASHYKVIDRFYIDNELLTFTTDNGGYSLTIEDIATCIGMMFGAYPHENMPFEKWIDDIQKMVNNAIIGGFFSGVYLFTDDMDFSQESVDGNDHVNLSFKNIKERPSMNDVKNAEILARSLLGELPNDLFDAWVTKFPTALEEYEKEFDRIKKIHQFNFDDLTLDVKQKIREHFEQFFPPEKYDEIRVQKLTHLAWAYANNYICLGAYDLHEVVEYIKFDDTGLELEDGGINLEVTFSRYFLNDLWDILKENNNVKNG